MNRPQPNEYPIWGETYISKVDRDIFEILNDQVESIPVLFRANADKADYAYAEGKWTLKEMLGHMIDTERVFAFRITCFARKEQQPLPGFEEDDYVLNARFAERELEDLIEEFAALRKANLYLFKSLNEEELNRKGIASGREINVKSILFIVGGHVIHHVGVLKERYHVV
ncbi:DinB family protein [Pedobacter sp. HDW13]|uniref:DinB family protein n=1 Tax=unclassified Pedobacter TaxID=2628915 RepID=UPI000F598E96|nr:MULTISPECIES: DinB family protein [unclassified Pedobacter]QIL39569.1 DinB family protein [Pedobacter sp. HDW13]RQO78546.1 DinB family protein [Pedobacter sp. KBW01]